MATMTARRKAQRVSDGQRLMLHLISLYNQRGEGPSLGQLSADYGCSRSSAQGMVKRLLEMGKLRRNKLGLLEVVKPR